MFIIFAGMFMDCGKKLEYVQYWVDNHITIMRASLINLLIQTHQRQSNVLGTSFWYMMDHLGPPGSV